MPRSGELLLDPNRDECRDGPRPCMVTQCRYSLLRDRNGGHPELDTCALDVADRFSGQAMQKNGARPPTLRELGAPHSFIARLMGITRQRVHQIEQSALRKVGKDMEHLIRLPVLP